MLHHEIVSSFLLKFVLKVLLNTKKKHNREEILTAPRFRVLNETLNTKNEKNRTLNRKKRRQRRELSLLIRVPTNTITQKKERL